MIEMAQSITFRTSAVLREYTARRATVVLSSCDWLLPIYVRASNLLKWREFVYRHGLDSFARAGNWNISWVTALITTHKLFQWLQSVFLNSLQVQKSNLNPLPFGWKASKVKTSAHYTNQTYCKLKINNLQLFVWYLSSTSYNINNSIALFNFTIFYYVYFCFQIKEITKVILEK